MLIYQTTQISKHPFTCQASPCYNLTMRDEPTNEPAPLLRQDRGQKTTRDRILASAERLFAERGFERVSMPAIAKASGVTAGAIYKHFESKADLLFEVVRSALSSVRLFSAPGSEVDL